MSAIVDKIYEQAKRLGACDKFKGTETEEELIELFLTDYGQEFCMDNHFPSLATLRYFKRFDLESRGIYIDAGAITLHNPERVYLAGRTSATINCDSLKSRNCITLLRGSKAVINASGWAVAFVKTEAGSTCIKNAQDNALIL